MLDPPRHVKAMSNVGVHGMEIRTSQKVRKYTKIM
jgi:hypothetical protein